MATTNGKIIGGVAGGLFAVAAAVLGWLFYSAYEARTTAEEELEDARAAFRRYNKAPVFPSRTSIAAVNTNTAAYAAWRARAELLVARGDKKFPFDEAPSAFKQRLASEVRRLRALPGGADGHLAAPTFFFGFEKYLGESAILPDGRDLPLLTVQLDSIVHFAEIFAEAGVLEVKDVVRVVPKPAEEEAPATRRSKKSAKAKAAADDAAARTTSNDYELAFLARPAAVVAVLNAFASDTRFTVVKRLAFKSSADTIVDKINAREAALQKKDEPQSSRRRRRRALADEAETAAPAKLDRLIVDPELDAPVLVNMTVTVYDFGQAAHAAETATDAAAENKETK